MGIPTVSSFVFVRAGFYMSVRQGLRARLGFGVRGFFSGSGLRGSAV